jgi:hypothetical protein
MFIYDSEYLSSVQKQEKEVEKYLVANWAKLFPFLKLIKSQYAFPPDLKVRLSKKTSGIVDILCFNELNNRFVVVEIKATKEDDSVLGQATDYSEAITNSFDRIHDHINHNLNIKLPEKKIFDRKVDIIVMVTSLDEDLIKKKFNVYRNPPIYVSYQFYKNSFENKEIFVFKTYSENQAFQESMNRVFESGVISKSRLDSRARLESYDDSSIKSTLRSAKPKNLRIVSEKQQYDGFDLKSTLKADSVRQNSQNRNNHIVNNAIQFPLVTDAKYRPDRNFRGFEVVVKIRRQDALKCYFSEVVGFDLGKESRLEVSEFRKYEMFGFMLYRASAASYYIFAKSDQIVSDNIELNFKFKKFRKKYPFFDTYT